MRKAFFAALAGTVTLAIPPTAQAAVVSSWALNDPVGSTTVRDPAGGNNGTATDVVFNGSYAAFNGTSSRISVPYNGNLSPGSQNVTVSVDINTTYMPGTSNFDFDLVRSTPGNPMYKVELYPRSVGAQAQCIFHGATANVTWHKGPSLDDGAWHTIVCTKTSNSVSLTIDGVTYTKSIVIGDITLAHKPFSIGWKPQGADFYHGLMQNVSVSIG
jgi:hypothetical protein